MKSGARPRLMRKDVRPTGGIVNERALVEALRQQLSPRYPRILAHQNLASLPAFKAELQQQFGYLPVLNEVDLILQRKTGQLCAVEVKCLDVRSGGFTRPFYDGIGQALSLLRYGFDHVALWHFFAGTSDQARLDRYGAATWWFIRNELQLPLEFTYFRVDGDEAAPRFTVMQYKSRHTGADLIPVDSTRFDVTWKHPNPLRDDVDAATLRVALAQALNLNVTSPGV